MQLTTYELTPYLPAEGTTFSPGSEMFSIMVNKWVRTKKEYLMEKEVDISLFFNHDLETGKTIIGYPKVIYHCIGDRFYLTGFNEGAFAVQQLANSYKKPFEENGIIFSGFKSVETVNTEVTVLSGQMYRYRLWKWIPFHRKDYGNFGQLPLAEKAVSLNQKLLKHISQDFARYLGLETTGLQAEIIQIAQNTYPARFL